jgi:hypothetical protein
LGKEERRARGREYARKRQAEDAEYRNRRCEYNRSWRALHKTEISAQRRLKWASDPEHRDKSRRARLRLLYAMSAEEYAALLARQNGVCAICKKRDRIRLCVDHCHDMRTVRGLLCTKCNIGLGCFDDDPERLRAAIAYLERARGRR